MKDLKNGFTLVPLGRKDRSLTDYSYLYKDDKRVCDTIFRAGGMCYGFRDGYCNLIKYSEDAEGHIDYGTFCIVNEHGEVKLEAKNTLEYPSHLKGIIGSIGDKIFNLVTGALIVRYSRYIKCKDYLFTETVYDRKFASGVRRIDWYTGGISYYKS